MTRTVSMFAAELADREAIRDCLYRYSRGVDRLDADCVRSAYWPDAHDNHLVFTGNTEAFIAWSFPVMGTMDQTQHIIANTIITIGSGSDANRADVEAYFYGFHRMNGPDGKFDAIGAGRYLDIFEKRDDEWRIIKRTVVTDWFRQYPDSADWTNGPLGMPGPAGARMPDDLSYSFVALKL